MDPRTVLDPALKMIRELENKISTLEASTKTHGPSSEIKDTHFTAGNVCFDYADGQINSEMKIQYFNKAGEHYDKAISMVESYNRNSKVLAELSVELHLSKLAVWKKLAETTDTNKKYYVDLIQNYLTTKNLEHVFSYLDNDTEKKAKKDLRLYQTFCYNENNNQCTNVLPLKKRFEDKKENKTEENIPVTFNRQEVDMDLSDDPFPPYRRPQTKPSATVTYANLFTQTIKHNTFTNTLKKFLTLFLTQQGHYASEILRQIANYHRNDRKKLNALPGDMLDIIEFLYEKSLVIEPTNQTTKDELANYQKEVSLRSNEQSLTAERRSRYEMECRKFGVLNFFWISITKYLDRLEKNYPDNNVRNNKLVDVLLHLDNSIELDKLTEDQQKSMGNIFANAINEMTPLSYSSPSWQY